MYMYMYIHVCVMRCVLYSLGYMYKYISHRFSPTLRERKKSQVNIFSSVTLCKTGNVTGNVDNCVVHVHVHVCSSIVLIC